MWEFQIFNKALIIDITGRMPWTFKALTRNVYDNSVLSKKALRGHISLPNTYETNCLQIQYTT